MKIDAPELKAIERSLEKQRSQRFWLAAAVTTITAGTIVLTLGSLFWLGWSLVAIGAVAGALSRW